MLNFFFVGRLFTASTGRPSNCCLLKAKR